MAALMPVAAGMLILGWHLAPQIQPDPGKSDQGAYAYMARSMRDAWWPNVTDGVRNPLFAWLASKFVRPEFETHEEIREYLVLGKRFNAAVAAVVMLAIGWHLSGLLPPLAAWNVAAVGGLGCLLPIAAYFGAEPLFYGLFYGMWMLGVELLQRNPLRLYFAFSLLTALAYLAKPSTTPFVLLLAAMSLLRWAVSWLPNLPAALQPGDWKPWRLVAGAGIFLAVVAAMTLPKNLYSARHFEDPFYNAPKVWFWMLDWKEAYPRHQLVRKSDLAALPPEERPGPATFLRRHGWDTAVFKLGDGTLIRLQQLFLPEKSFPRKVEPSGGPKRVVLPFRGLYLAAAIGLMLVMLGVCLARGRFRTIGGWALPSLFVLGTFAAYTLAYGWYAWVGPGPRYIMSLYLPVMALALLAAHILRQAAHSRFGDLAWLISLAIPPLLVVPRMLALLADPRFEKMMFAF